MKLELIDLWVSTPEVNLVKGINLTIESGSTLALVGASGSGKSVTCSAIFDLLAPGLKRSGKILLDGKPADLSQQRGRNITSIMQNPASAFNPLQTMRQHGFETLVASGQGKDLSLLAQAMQDAGLEDWKRVLGLYPFQMSGGMLQRMMLALALVSQAPLLIADEPTTDLDLLVQSRILQRLESITTERALGVLLVTHDFGVVARLADRVAVMAEGEIVEYASVSKIFSQPKHPVTRSLLNAHLSLYKETVSG